MRQPLFALLRVGALPYVALLYAAASPLPTALFGADGAEVGGGARHWAYEALRRAPLPAVRDIDWPRNPIDAFVLARLEKAGFSPAPVAERARLLRRVYLDLLGVPPTVEEVDAFLADLRPEAYDLVIDRLLASPLYGEHWARHWLDLARYADSNGFQRDGHRSAWAYRDWVIAAFNDDMPFDRFTIEQLAGDLLPGSRTAQKIATGFHRSTTVNVEAGVDREEDRTNAVIDRVNTTATVWLGSTIACAQCHDHKYDPFTQREYYQLFAYFNSTELETSAHAGSVRQFTGPRMTLPEPPERVRQRDDLQALRSRRQRELDALIGAATTEQGRWEESLREQTPGARTPDAGTLSLDGIPERIRALLAVAEAARNDAQRRQLTEFYLGTRPAVRSPRGELEELDRRLEALAPWTTLTLVELEAPRSTRIFRRGSFLQPGAAVELGVPAALHPLPADLPPNRLGLARWLVDPQNPLVGRVTVNRWWAEFFGRGLVATLEDFGTQGELPTHPELLDWLASEFIARNWSMKAVHRLIVSSATYRQSSRRTAGTGDEAATELYARAPRFRLDAERIRDNALAASGLLCLKMGGPPVRPPQPDGIWNVIGVVDNTYRPSQGVDRYRRGVYTVWRRSSPYPSFVTFDAPDRASTCTRRPRTNTPLQALVLMNDPAFVECAFALAVRLVRDRPRATPRERASYGFRLSVARRPSAAVAEHLEGVYARERERYAGAPQAVERLLSGRDVPPGVDRGELAAWFFVATILLNLDETITRG